jgi:hypothetical protein
MIPEVRLVAGGMPARPGYDRDVVPSQPLTTRLGPRQWMAVDAVVAAGMLAVLVAFAAYGHPRDPGPEHSLGLYLLAPLASLPLAVRRRWPVTVLAAVLAASVAFCVLGSVISTITGASYALYTVAVQAGRKWSCWRWRRSRPEWR